LFQTRLGRRKRAGFPLARGWHAPCCIDVVSNTAHATATSIEGNSMNIQKHMEAIFITTLAVVGAGSLIIDRLPDAEARPALPAAHAIGTPGHMAVVIVRGHKLPHRA
jgi:hypothetical protein